MLLCVNWKKCTFELGRSDPGTAVCLVEVFSNTEFASTKHTMCWMMWRLNSALAWDVDNDVECVCNSCKRYTQRPKRIYRRSPTALIHSKSNHYSVCVCVGRRKEKQRMDFCFGHHHHQCAAVVIIIASFACASMCVCLCCVRENYKRRSGNERYHGSVA